MEMRESVKKHSLQEAEAVTMIWSAVMSATEWNKKEDLVMVSYLSHLTLSYVGGGYHDQVRYVRHRVEQERGSRHGMFKSHFSPHSVLCLRGRQLS